MNASTGDQSKNVSFDRRCRHRRRILSPTFREKKSKEGSVMCIVVASTKRLQAGRDILGLKKAENQELMLIFTYSKGRDTNYWLGHFQT